MNENKHLQSLNYNQLLTLLEKSKIGTFEYNIATNKIIFSKEWAALLEYDPSELENLTFEQWQSFIFPLDKANLLATIHQCIINCDEDSFYNEHRKITKKGKLIWIGISGYVFRDSNGKAQKLIALHNEIKSNLQSKIKINEALVSNEIIGNINDGIVLTDFDDNIVFCNKKASFLLNKPFQELKHSNIFNVDCTFILADGKIINKKLHPIKLAQVREKKVVSHILGIKTAASSSILWVKFTANPIIVEKSTYIFSVITDITDFVKEQNKSNTFLKQLKNIINLSPNIIFECRITENKQIDFTFISDKVQNIYGLSPEALYKNSNLLFAQTHPADSEKLIQTIHYAIDNFSIWKHQFRSFDVNNKMLWLNGFSAPYITKSGEVLWTGYIQDITETKKQKSDLNRFAVLVNATSNAVVFADIKGRILWVNASFTNLTGYTLNEVKGKTPGSFLQFKKTSKATVKKIGVAILNRTKINVDILNVSKQGREYWINLLIEPVFENNEFIGFISLSSDITEYKLAEAEKEILLSELTQKVQELKQFTYILSHNLRAPLSNIMGYCGYILNNKAALTKEETFELITPINTSSLILDNTIKDLNTVLNMQNRFNTYELFNIQSYLNQILTEFKFHYNSTEIKYILNYNNITTIKTIKHHIESILYNLISNAIKYVKPNEIAEIKITINKISNNYNIEIEDNGIGIDLERNREKLFGFYQRFNIEKEGKGLGLFLTKWSVKALKGTINVTSRLNEGTIFSIYIPVVP